MKTRHQWSFCTIWILVALSLSPRLCGAPVLTSIFPTEVLPDEATSVILYFTGLEPGAVISFEGAGNLQFPGFVDDGLYQYITGFAPPLAQAVLPGLKDITVTVTDSSGPTIFDDAVRYVGFNEPYCMGILPSELPPEAGTKVRLLGRHLQPGLIPVIGGLNCFDPGVNCLSPTFIDDKAIDALAPALAERKPPDYPVYAAQIRNGAGGPIVACRPNFVTVKQGTAPPKITFVEAAEVDPRTPPEVDPRKPTVITVHGENFRPGPAVTPTRVSVLFLPDQLFHPTFDPVTPDQIIRLSGDAFNPLDPATPPGLKDLYAADARGESYLRGAINYVDKIRRVYVEETSTVSPARISAAGGEMVTFEGFGFEVEQRMRIGDVILGNQKLMGHEIFKGKMLPLPVGIYDARVVDSIGRSLGYLPRAVEVVLPPPATLSRVTPRDVPTAGGKGVLFEGLYFHPGLTPRLGGIPLESHRVIDSNLLEGFSPELSAGAHEADLVDAAGNVVASLENAVLATAPADDQSLPPPTPTETSLAEGTARFEWTIPIRYDRILVSDANGGIIRTLLGTDNGIELPAAGTDAVAIGLTGCVGDLRSREATMIAYRPECQAAPPVTGDPRECDDTKKCYKFTLYGGFPDDQPDRICDDGFVDFIEDPLELAQNGFAQAESSIGYVVGANVVSNSESQAAVPRLRQKVITGFTLTRDADKLFIEGFYTKYVDAYGLKLKGRLIHVYPEDGFVDEFTFPSGLVGAGGWNGITYYRASRDILDPRAVPCGIKIPRGDYRLEFFAANGSRDIPHFGFDRDGRADQKILVKGVPCPPYPRVRVTDSTGTRSLPDFGGLTAQQIADPSGACCRVKFSAHGTWSDEHGVRHTINIDDRGNAQNPYVDTPFFEFKWKVYDKAGGTEVTTNQNPIEIPVSHLGCYAVEITVRDKDCGRSRTYSFEAFTAPADFKCLPGNPTDRYSVINPTPDISDIRAVAGLSPAPGFPGEVPQRSLETRVLVVPPACCGNALCSAPAPAEGDVEFRLALETVEGDPESAIPVLGPIRGLDLCQNRTEGPKYFRVKFLDLGQASAEPFRQMLGKGKFGNVHLQARTVTLRTPGHPEGILAPNPRWDVVNNWYAYERDRSPHYSGRFRMSAAPESLSNTHWTGSFDPAGQVYHFLTQSTSSPMDRVFSGSSMEYKLPIIGQSISLPSLPAFFDVGLNPGFCTIGEEWLPEPAKGTAGGRLLGSDIACTPLGVAGRKLSELGHFSWQTCQTIFDQSWEQTLFESILFTGTIGPIPVTVWGSIGLGVRLALDAKARAEISLFNPLSSGKHFEGDIYLDSTFGVTVPASLRTDILLGVVSHSYDIHSFGDAVFGVNVGARDTDLIAGYEFQVHLALAVTMKVCLFWYLCTPPQPIIVIPPTPLFVPPLEGGNRGNEFSCLEALGAGARDSLPAEGGGGSAFRVERSYIPTVKTAIASSPDGQLTLEVGQLAPRASENQLIEAAITIKENGRLPRTTLVQATNYSPALRDAATAFIANDRFLIASTASHPDELPPGLLPPPETGPQTIAEFNNVLACDEIQVDGYSVGSPPNGPLLTGGSFRVSDDPGTPLADRRADGQAVIAGTSLHGDAIVGWVRVDDPQYLVTDPGQTITYTFQEGDPFHAGAFVETPLPTVRPHLEKSAIFVRYVNFDGPIPGEPARAISRGGINVEPTIAFSPSGNTACCAWVNDPSHVDLIRSNRGRNILCAFWSRQTGSWSAPVPVVADTSAYPGILEPSVVMSGDSSGVLAFTALPPSTPERDVGLSNRIVFIVHFENGVFGAPQFLRNRCLERQATGYKVLVLHPPDQFEIPPIDHDKYVNPSPCYLVVQEPDWNAQFGSEMAINIYPMNPATQQAAAPVNIAQDSYQYTNIAATVSSAGVQINALKYSRPFGLGAGAGVGFEDPDPVYASLSMPLEPDLAIVSCELTDDFPAPGTLVKATVTVENIGLAGSTRDRSGNSLVGFDLVFVYPDGRESVVAQSPLEVLQPGDRAQREFEIEQPHEPVRIKAVVNPNPIDRNRANDSRECFFGAPEPTLFECNVPQVPEGAAQAAVQLSWTAPVSYDEFYLYRDGSLLKTLPGTERVYADFVTEGGPKRYDLRGLIGRSRSRRVSSTCTVPPLGPQETFRRGDVDADGTPTITDAISVLNFLFLGGPGPACPDAADADDSGTLAITDPIRILGYLFLGSAEPPSPGANTCGPDPTSDNLEACQATCR